MAGFFETLFGGGAEKEAAEKNRQLYQQYQQQGLGALEQGVTQAKPYLTQAVGAYDPLANLGATYSAGAPTLMGALGIGTPEQQAAARSAFTASPGYDWQMQQGLDAINRRRAISGMYASGNADIDTLRFSQGLADQEYQNWLNNLKQTGQLGLGATGAAAAGRAGGYTNLGNLYTQNALNQLGLYGNVTSGMAGANQLQAAGEAAGAKNLLGAGLGLASLFTGGGGAGGLGNPFSWGGGTSGGAWGASPLMKLFA